MAFFAFRLHKGPRGAADESSLEIMDNGKVRVKDSGVSTAKIAADAVTHAKLAVNTDRYIETDTGAGVTDSVYPNMCVGLTVNTETMADGSNDDVALGQVCVATGNAVEGIIGDIGSATADRVTAVINRSGGVLNVTVADESNTKINGQGKRLAIVDTGYCVLIEKANDQFRIIDAAGVTLVAF